MGTGPGAAQCGRAVGRRPRAGGSRRVWGFVFICLFSKGAEHTPHWKGQTRPRGGRAVMLNVHKRGGKDLPTLQDEGLLRVQKHLQTCHL